MSQSAVTTAVQGKLTGDTGAGGVATLTGSRIYAINAVQDCATPYVAWGWVTDVPVNYFSTSDMDAEFDLNVYGKRIDGPAAVQVVADAAYTLLHKQTIAALTGATCICLDRGQVMDEIDYYRHLQRWRIVATGV